jgi:hypothetical protein
MMVGADLMNMRALAALAAPIISIGAFKFVSAEGGAPNAGLSESAE